jgi:penicillin-binding protein 2X
MSIKNKIKKIIQKKNLNPMNNRKKVGIMLFATSIGLFFLFAFRTTYIIATDKVADVSLKQKAADLYEGSTVVKAKRGTIYDRYGNAIAEDATSYSVYVILSHSYVGVDKKRLYAEQKEFETIADVFAKYTKITKEKALKVLNNGLNGEVGPKFQVEFGTEGKNISLETKQKIENELKEKKIPGVDFNEHPARIYPNGVFASHFIGYTALADPKKEEKGLVGKMGLEQAYNDILSGKDGRVYYQKDVYNNPLPGTVAEEEKAEDGQDIYTTLDVRLQSKLESLMDPVVEKYEPENVTAMLMDAKTGEILAMSQRPTFNPETKAGLDNDGTWQNLLVEGSYEPGSTMKLFTTAASMELGQYNPNETFSRVGGIKIGDRTINDHDNTNLQGKEYLTYRQALSWSSNVGMVNLEQRMGGSTWVEYMKKFGFGSSTDSGLYGETAGQLPADNIVDQAMSAFGQGVSVSNFQMMKAYSAIANDGTMLQPHYISKVVNNTGEEKVTQPEVLGTPITAQTASAIRSYMVDTVEDPTYGIAHNVYQVPGYHIAAKTGTAQITDGGNGYLDGANEVLSSVVEMVPADNPEYVLYVTIKRTKAGTGSPGEAMASIANPLMKLALDIKDTSETTEADQLATEPITVADFRNMNKDEAAASARVNGVVPVIVGDGGTVKQQSTAPGETLLPNQKLLLLTDGKKIMPDVSEWSKSDVTKLGKLLDVDIEFKGEGYVKAQSVAAGTEITGDKITITLAGTQ